MTDIDELAYIQAWPSIFLQKLTQPICAKTTIKSGTPKANARSANLQSSSHLVIQNLGNGTSLFTVSYRRIATKMKVAFSMESSIKQTTNDEQQLNDMRSAGETEFGMSISTSVIIQNPAINADWCASDFSCWAFSSTNR